MIDNHCEDRGLNEELCSFHKKEIELFGLPCWFDTLECPFCHKVLPIESIRFVGFRLNTRNFGDLVVEFHCKDCCKMDTLYFRREIEDVDDFCDVMTDGKMSLSKPIVEEEMYKLQYNNIIEKKFSRGDKNASV